MRKDFRVKMVAAIALVCILVASAYIAVRRSRGDSASAPKPAPSAGTPASPAGSSVGEGLSSAAVERLPDAPVTRVPDEPLANDATEHLLNDIVTEHTPDISDRTFAWSGDGKQHRLSAPATECLEMALERYRDIEEINFTLEGWNEGEHPERAESKCELLVSLKSNNDLTMTSLKPDKVKVEYLDGTRYIWEGGKATPTRVDNIEEGLGIKIPSLLSRFSYDDSSETTVTREEGGKQVERAAVCLVASRDNAEVLIDSVTKDVLAVTFTMRITQTGVPEEEHESYVEYLDYREIKLADGRTFRFPTRIRTRYDNRPYEYIVLREFSAEIKDSGD